MVSQSENAHAHFLRKSMQNCNVKSKIRNNSFSAAQFVAEQGEHGVELIHNANEICAKA